MTQSIDMNNIYKFRGYLRKQYWVNFKNNNLVAQLKDALDGMVSDINININDFKINIVMSDNKFYDEVSYKASCIIEDFINEASQNIRLSPREQDEFDEYLTTNLLLYDTYLLGNTLSYTL